VTICHKGRRTLNINDNSVPAHLLHRDTLGPCPIGDDDDRDDRDSRKSRKSSGRSWRR
jgi:hypothetical protein